MEFAIVLGATAGAIGLSTLVSKELKKDQVQEEPVRYFMRDNGAKDCIVTGWSEWTPCDYDSGVCGMGSRLSTRTVYRQPLYAGADCPPLREERNCYRPCPVNCRVSNWVETACTFPNKNQTCGEGKKTRIRRITRRDAHGGAPCPTDLSVEEPCIVPCECKMSPWSAWSECTAKQEGQWGQTAGTRQRTKQVLQNASHTASPCPTNLLETEDCSIPKPQDCQYTRKPSQSPSCVPKLQGSYGPRAGTVTYELQQTIAAQPGGEVCPEYENEDCDLIPVNCTYEYENSYGECIEKEDAFCDPSTGTKEGWMLQAHHILTQETNGGTCNVPSQYAACTIPCDVDCKTERVTEIRTESGSTKPVTSWDDLVCIPNGTNACGPGVKKWPRAVAIDQKNSGAPCPRDDELYDSSECEIPCPIDCKVSYPPWSSIACVPKPASVCNMEGKREGVKIRTRTIIEPAKNDGTCHFPETEQEDCELDCPVDCIKEWGDWTECAFSSSAPAGTWCGPGTETRVQIEKSSAINNGSCTLEQESRDCMIPCTPTRFPPAEPSYNPSYGPSYGPSGGPYSRSYTWISPYTGMARIEVAGGAGGSGQAGPGGRGAKISAVIRVTQGEQFTVYIGEKGGDVDISSDPYGRCGGGGGGGSAILKGNVLLVVAGGGGGTASSVEGNGIGGHGGLPDAQDGQGAGDTPGKRATTTQPGFGGQGGVSGNSGLPFDPQRGGTGGNSVHSALRDWIPGGHGFGSGGMGSRDDERGGSGGGGGGYHGGGSGSSLLQGSSGGGGSSYINPEYVFQVSYSINEFDNGYVEFADTCDSPPCRVDCVYSEWVNEGTCIIPSGQCQGKQVQTRRIIIDGLNQGTPCDTNALRREIDCSVPCQPSTVERSVELVERRRLQKPGRAYESWTYTPTRTDTLQRVRFRFSVQSNKRGCGNRSSDSDMGCDWGIEGSGVYWYGNFRDCWSHSAIYTIQGKGPFQFSYYAHDCHMFVNAVEEHVS